jgi:AcrR family transcriptional regulator
VSTPAVDPRPLRADAERNRKRLLDAARRLFAERGFDASVDEISRQAGVGMGTLYRHFPTKRDLALAVAEDRTESVIAGVQRAAKHADPWTALREALLAFVEVKASDHGFFDAVREEIGGDLRPIRERLYAAYRPVVQQAHAARVLRDDVALEDLIPLVGPVGRLPPAMVEANPEIWRRYFAIIMDGLRPEGATALPYGPPAA